MNPFSITEDGVHKLLQNINPTKAGRPDSVPGCILKILAVGLAPTLTSSPRTKPEVMCHSNGEDVDYSHLQKWPKCEAANYRPVSLRCITSKLLEHIYCSQIRGHLDLYGILSPFPHGFRGAFTQEKDVDSGWAQGAVLAPLIFLLFINDIDIHPPPY